jgi:gluconokinase
MIVAVMGVSGSGKTTVGALLAERSGCAFADADDYHSEANRRKMKSGIPLNDDDRAAWLAALNHLLRAWVQAGKSGVLACSALKEAYRRKLVAGLPAGAVSFVLLEGSRELLAQRLRARHHEFMSPSLLDSQLATLEVPTDALRVSIEKPAEAVVAEILEALCPPRQNPA